MSRTDARTAIITGGQSGLGEACATRLRSDGIQVVTFDISPDADVVVDVTDPAAVDAAVADGRPGRHPDQQRRHRRTQQAALGDRVSTEWTRTFDVNVHGLFSVTRAVVPGMVERGWGRIVSMASMAGKDGNPNLSAYSASKAAVIGLTKSLGKELAKTGVLVNAIAPAVIATPMNATNTPEVLAHLTSLIPMGRVGQPGGGRGARRLAHLRRVQLLDRSRLRHQRRPGDLLEELVSSA